MRTVKEICDLFGITRKTLRGYDKIGLLHPTSTENKCWRYDEEAIFKLQVIQVFVEAGYERRRIKEILESPETDFANELDMVVEFLLEKRNRIEGMISRIRMIKADIVDRESSFNIPQNLNQIAALRR